MYFMKTSNISKAKKLKKVQTNLKSLSVHSFRISTMIYCIFLKLF